MAFEQIDGNQKQADEIIDRINQSLDSSDDIKVDVKKEANEAMEFKKGESLVDKLKALAAQEDFGEEHLGEKENPAMEESIVDKLLKLGQESSATEAEYSESEINAERPKTGIYGDVTQNQAAAENIGEDNPYYFNGLVFLEDNPGAFGYICSAEMNGKEMPVNKGFMTSNEYYDYIKKLGEVVDLGMVRTVYGDKLDLYRSTLHDSGIATESVNQETKMKITIQSGLSADGFDISITQNGKEVFNNTYRYGYNASYSKSFADKNKPYVTDLIKELKDKYRVKDVEVVNGKNVFTDKDVRDEKVNQFINDYLNDLDESFNEGYATEGLEPIIDDLEEFDYRVIDTYKKLSSQLNRVPGINEILDYLSKNYDEYWNLDTPEMYVSYANAVSDTLKENGLEEVSYVESATEDTIKQGSHWVNKGKEGTHGKFRTKKAADAQRKAMFARGYQANEEIGDEEMYGFEAMSTPDLEAFQAVIADQLDKEGSISTLEKLIDKDLTYDFTEQINFIKNTSDLSNTNEVLNEILNAAETLLDDMQIETLVEELSKDELEEPEEMADQEFEEYQEPEDWSKVDETEETVTEEPIPEERNLEEETI